MTEYKRIFWLAEAEAFSEEMAQIRHQIHSWPELGNAEFQTSSLIQMKLKELGISTVSGPGTAVRGLLFADGESTEGRRTIGFRADMDALPLEERTGVSWASQRPEIMHGCGHDFHTAALLGAAYVLQNQRARLRGNIQFLFQPDEEGNGGAARMIDAGALEQPFVEAVYGAHVDPGLPAGRIGLRSGAFYAASDMFTIRVTGKSAHGAQPEQGIDALRAAAQMVLQLDQLSSGDAEEKPWGRAVVTAGRLNGGSAGNILAGQAELEGILRSFGKENRRKLKEALQQTVSAIEEESGVRAEIQLRESYPGIVNHEEETETVKRAALTLFGENRISHIRDPLMTTEDFGCFLEQRRGAFFHLGTGGDYPLHHPSFCPPDWLLPHLAALYCQIAEEEGIIR